MPSSLFSLFGMRAYVAAEAYAQTQAADTVMEFQAVNPPIASDNRVSAFFTAENPDSGRVTIHPYRGSYLPFREFGSLGLPIKALVYAFSEIERRGSPLSILAHHHFGGFYEVTEGVELPSPPEETFFGFELVAQVRTPQKKCLPSPEEISWLRSKVMARPGDVSRLVLLGFCEGQPAFVQMSALTLWGNLMILIKLESSDNMARGVAEFLANFSASNP